ncbi:hypothetical protein L227DRAFT_577990 [Lentinus tigrinus ALCF2SS1-6]|uniref:Uncharacterized protein n=2 Tax=Lentinus tigrinus TaxID=5365 RepID=A0A5C2S1J9_9APHY|nr:hypothetical protein L227DRAFT_577990 [Lentinus tigrinus ALCF2SS1-6]
MAVFDQLYQRILHDAVVNDAPSTSDPISMTVVYPERRGALVAGLQGGGMQTADVVLPGCVVTLVVARIDVLPPSGEVAGLGMTSASLASAVLHDGQQGAGGALERVHAVLANVPPVPANVPRASISPAYDMSEHVPDTPVNIPDSLQTLDPILAPHFFPSAFQCDACSAAGAMCWRRDVLQDCERCMTYGIRCSDDQLQARQHAGQVPPLDVMAIESDILPVSSLAGAMDQNTWRRGAEPAQRPEAYHQSADFNNAYYGVRLLPDDSPFL